MTEPAIIASALAAATGSTPSGASAATTSPAPPSARRMQAECVRRGVVQRSQEDQRAGARQRRGAAEQPKRVHVDDQEADHPI
ncbi:MAG: hypothetical protein KF786_15740 [Burkholderiaceae bacterium]|nr:hypothetical protein [Burkholderiaceae bacterium]